MTGNLLETLIVYVEAGREREGVEEVVVEEDPNI